MSRKVKEQIKGELARSYAGMDAILLVNVHPLTGVEANALRRELGGKEIAVHVVKNSVGKRVLEGTPLRGLASVLTGPCAWVTGGVSAVDTAKELVRLSKEYPRLELRHGILEGETEPMPVTEIAKLKSRAELQGELLGLLMAPGRRLAGCLSVGAKIAGCIKAIVDKVEKGETVAKVA